MHALVTGASSGIGAAIATALGRHGWNLTLAARREEALRRVAKTCQGETLVRPTDLSELQQCAPLVEEATKALGPIDLLVNNAGVQYVEPTLDISDERAEFLMTVDLLAPMRLTRIIGKTMIDRGRGNIVNIASMAAITHTPGMCHYNAAKAGLAAASESLRVELEKTGVHVMTVYPGPVHSEMETQARASFEESWALSRIPTGTPEELAALILKGIQKKSPRLVYPKIYGASRFGRATSQWFVDRFSPKLK